MNRNSFLLFLAFIAISSMQSFGQTCQIVWANGRLLYGTPVTNIDSLTYDNMQDVDTLCLLFPKVLTNTIHDTIIVQNTVTVHDTITVRDTITIWNTITIRDTIYVTNPDTIPSVPDIPVEKKYEWVDLGVSVMWATCNVGAEKPEDYGDYFSWAETVPKAQYSWETYKYGTAYDKLLKYCKNYGLDDFTDNKVRLELADDAANINWGEDWHIPTNYQMEELILSCNWEWTSINGVYGYKVSSKRNDNSIFLPASGYYHEGSVWGKGAIGSYWTNDLNPGSSHMALYLKFNANESTGSELKHRYYGYTVRPVMNK